MGSSSAALCPAQLLYFLALHEGVGVQQKRMLGVHVKETRRVVPHKFNTS